MTESTDVLVVGAGPAGLALACGLRLQGVAVRVVDQASGPATTSRANILHARGVEVLDRLGALGDLPDRSAPALVLTTHIAGRPAMKIHFGDAGLGTPRPALVLPQTAVEAQLRDRLAELGGTVEWDTAVTGAAQDDQGITAALSSGETVRAGWLAGCDGAHSLVRKLAGIRFPGAPLTDSWLLADAHADFDLPRVGGHGWAHPDGPLFAMPMPDHPGAEGGSLWRLMAYLPGAKDEKLTGDEILNRFRHLASERAGLPGERIRDANWASVFRVHRRLAETYRQGRTLLAGDAAHIHSPAGGQGMVTGIGDAENLAWKLALVVQGHAGRALLDTYQAERRPLATEVLRNTSAVARLQIGNSGLVRQLVRWVLVPIFSRPAVQRQGTLVASQLSVSYRRGPLADRGRWPGRRPRPGDRVPDWACRHPHGGTTRLHAELGGRWVLLGDDDTATACLPAVRSRLADRITALTAADTEAGSEGPRMKGEVWLIRPDAHLAWRGRPGTAALGRWLEGALQHGRVRA
ncbi:FAD-dependent monooxygenase [Streptomyces ovatisporus]|uniref:FAD-dependent monooxygenase n=1 Tax=Streptomyces ovatisporus TaxID=1128682 RepID=A0ABV9AES2_9ACTN